MFLLGNCHPFSATGPLQPELELQAGVGIAWGGGVSEGAIPAGIARQ
jgi:hypothetical protein